jgi:AcrR family transcriptional regulator
MNVMEIAPLTSSSGTIRVEPVQARSAARVNALLDAASDVMHDLGYEQLTTAMVADRAGASIGTVYRYFPDRVAVLQAVAARNLDRTAQTLACALAVLESTEVQAAIDCVVDTLVGVFRDERGYRSIRVGDCLDIRPVTSGRSGNVELARVVRDDLHQRAGLRLDSAGRFAIETAIDVIDTLLARAFLSSERGDSTLIEEARRMGRAAVADI